MQGIRLVISSAERVPGKTCQTAQQLHGTYKSSLSATRSLLFKMTSNNGGSYLDAIKSSCSRYPDLTKLHRFLSRPSRFRGRAAVLEFGGSRVQRINFSNPETLSHYLSDSGGTRTTCKHRLYLLEDLTCPYVEAFGSHFWPDPILFASHENSNHWSGTKMDYGMNLTTLSDLWLRI